ncbi:semaphorin-1A [Vespula squamosa]|uniref:Semaphorin-1A n=1 Tax=Vespula squamosa TaxID=30214 RepID=A0ABD2ATG7_VESSQ
MRRRITEVTTSTMHPVLFCWCVAAIFSAALAAWQENVRPKMYVQLGETTMTTMTTTRSKTTMRLLRLLRQLRRL